MVKLLSFWTKNNNIPCSTFGFRTTCGNSEARDGNFVPTAWESHHAPSFFSSPFSHPLPRKWSLSPRSFLPPGFFPSDAPRKEQRTTDNNATKTPPPPCLLPSSLLCGPIIEDAFLPLPPSLASHIPNPIAVVRMQVRHPSD